MREAKVKSSSRGNGMYGKFESGSVMMRSDEKDRWAGWG